jgi:hypothetical protein
MSRTIDTHLARAQQARLWDHNGVRVVPVYTYGYRLELLADAPEAPAPPGARKRHPKVPFPN